MSDPNVLAPNRRVAFLINQSADMQNWRCVPLYIGMILAPLYDHSPLPQQIASIGSVLVATWLWMRLLRRWIENRVDLSQLRAARIANPSMPGRRREAAIWAEWILVVVAIVILRRNSPQYHPHGWLEQSTGVWLCLAIVLCLSRAFDATNLRQRRVWNGVSAVALMISYGFLGTSPQSYAELLVVLGIVYLVLALLDTGMLLHLAVTPISEGSRSRTSE